MDEKLGAVYGDGGGGDCFSREHDREQSGHVERSQLLHSIGLLSCFGHPRSLSLCLRLPQAGYFWFCFVSLPNLVLCRSHVWCFVWVKMVGFLVQVEAAAPHLPNSLQDFLACFIWVRIQYSKMLLSFPVCSFLCASACFLIHGVLSMAVVWQILLAMLAYWKALQHLELSYWILYRVLRIFLPSFSGSAFFSVLWIFRYTNEILVSCKYMIDFSLFHDWKFSASYPFHSFWTLN